MESNLQHQLYTEHQNKSVWSKSDFIFFSKHFCKEMRIFSFRIGNTSSLSFVRFPLPRSWSLLIVLLADSSTPASSDSSPPNGLILSRRWPSDCLFSARIPWLAYGLKKLPIKLLTNYMCHYNFKISLYENWNSLEHWNETVAISTYFINDFSSTLCLSFHEFV